MPIYFSRGGGGQKGFSPVIQVLSARGTVEAHNYGSYPDWYDIAAVTFKRASSNTRFHYTVRAECKANSSGSNYGIPTLRLAYDNGNGAADNASTAKSFGDGPSASDEHDTTSFTYFSDYNITGSDYLRFRLQLKCNRTYESDSSTDVSANATGSLEIIETETF